MRLWSLHPKFLDTKGLGACWREALLAQAVLTGRTTAYKHHPQLSRFRSTEDPVGYIGVYLLGLYEEASCRGYRYNKALIDRPAKGVRLISVTDGQLSYEWKHLKRKLLARSYAVLQSIAGASVVPHPLFTVVNGGVVDWEIVNA